MGKCPDGDFIDENGRVLGRHKGIIHYTVGQRKGLGISLGERVFVTDINPINNTVTLSPVISGSNSLRLTDMVYSGMSESLEKVEVELSVKLRYTAPLVKVHATLYPDKTAILTFDEPQKSAPGQSAVLYKNGIVMCGGFINKLQ
jgi:tRNA-specific 2-thiouridylase